VCENGRFVKISRDRTLNEFSTKYAFAEGDTAVLMYAYYIYDKIIYEILKEQCCPKIVNFKIYKKLSTICVESRITSTGQFRKSTSCLSDFTVSLIFK